MFEFINFSPPGPVIVILIILILCYFLTSEYLRNYGLPPGPFGLPWLGYAPWLNMNRISQQLAELCDKYKTDILSVTLFGGHFVVLNTYELTKEIFQRRSDVCDRAHYSVMFNAVIPGYSGILTNSGRQWREGRKFSISNLKDFGMGRCGAEEMILNEARILCDRIKAKNNEAFDPQADLNIAVSNITCGLVFGQTFDHNDPEFLNALDGMNRFISRFNSQASFIIMQFRLVREFIMKDRFREISRDLTDYTQFTKNRIQEHKETYTGQGTDLIYAYLREMEQVGNQDVFDDLMLECLIADFFLAGSETTYTTLRWCLLVLAGYPEVYMKVREEVDQVIGEREPCMADKKNTPYCEAVINEVQRHFTLSPIGLGHSNLDHDIEINGYRVPKGSFIIGNLNQIHHDKHTWKNPDVFDPENFLEEGKVANTERLVPFGIGRRSCAGEALARMELYLFFISLVKNFYIKLETDVTTADFVGIQVAVYKPKPFKLRLKARC